MTNGIITIQIKISRFPYIPINLRIPRCPAIPRMKLTKGSIMQKKIITPFGKKESVIYIPTTMIKSEITKLMAEIRPRLFFITFSFSKWKLSIFPSLDERRQKKFGYSLFKKKMLIRSFITNG